MIRMAEGTDYRRIGWMPSVFEREFRLTRAWTYGCFIVGSLCLRGALFARERGWQGPAIVLAMIALPVVPLGFICLYQLYAMRRRRKSYGREYSRMKEAAPLIAATVETTLLKPRKARRTPPDASKLGGTPDLRGAAGRPACGACRKPMQFVLQLTKKDFPAFPFPKKETLFSLWRCAQEECSSTPGERSDRPIAWRFTAPSGTAPEAAPETQFSEGFRIEPCRFLPRRETEYGNEHSHPREWERLAKKIGDDAAYEDFAEAYPTYAETKIDGYPTWIQPPDVPKCRSCRNSKSFLMQLCSDEKSGLMHGDGGTIYFFHCRDCGPESIETRWDCY